MAVDVQSLVSSYDHEIRRARTDTLMQFRALVMEELNGHPERRDAILAELRDHRNEFRAAGREDMEDIVLDAMDILTGWAARAVRV